MFRGGQPGVDGALASGRRSHGRGIAAYRMAEEGWSADEALEEMKMFGFTAAHPVICPGLAFYAKHFPDHLKTNPAFKDLELPAAAAGQK